MMSLLSASHFFFFFGFSVFVWFGSRAGPQV